MIFPAFVHLAGDVDRSQDAVFSAGEVLDCLSDGVIATDASDDESIVYVNRAACEITGYAPEELLGRSPRMLQGKDTDRSVMRRLRDDLAAGRQFNGEAVNYRKDGTPFVMEWTISTLTRADGVAAFHVAVQRDATMPARRLLDAEREARTDPLTGLPNRSHIDDILEGGGWLVTRARSTVVVDVDHFKEVNDTYGHLVGDEVLRLVAGRLAAAARSGDIVARWGGEEFCVLMLGQGDAEAQGEASASLAQRIVEVISTTPFSTSAGELAVTVSAGSASLSSSCQTAPDLLRAADRAMYSAKRHGRNRAEHN
jgi:diguanylate cyclase (GGDEF)-like protein/PAS domain S-box-containing protein